MTEGNESRPSVTVDVQLPEEYSNSSRVETESDGSVNTDVSTEHMGLSKNNEEDILKTKMITYTGLTALGLGIHLFGLELFVGTNIFTLYGGTQWILFTALIVIGIISVKIGINLELDFLHTP